MNAAGPQQSAKRSPAGVASGLLWSMRPHEWIKNLLVFAAVIFSGQFFARESLAHSAGAFAAMCLASSATYLFNDVRDRAADRNHPEKRHRPIACGRVAPGQAVFAAVAAGILGIAIGFGVNGNTGWTVTAYLALTTAYSLILKHIAILDVLVLAAGFVLRVIAGAEAIDVMFSSWLVLCTFLLALFLGFGKRRNELVTLDEGARDHRPILAEYSVHFLDLMIVVVTSATVMSYVLYTMDAETIARFHSSNLIYTSVFVLYGIFRYLYLIHLKAAGGNPVTVFYRDLPLKIDVLLWIATVIYLRYAP